MLDEEKARRIMRELQAPQDVIDHCEAVNRVCLETVEKLRRKNPALKINKRLVSIAALLHDIGRMKTQGIDHAVTGAQILRDLNTDNDPDMENVAQICEKHIGGGITRSEAAKLGLPDKDYVPKTIEEKIVAYCDNLIDEEDGKIIVREPSWVAMKYEKKHGKNSEPALMVKELNAFFEGLLS